MKKFTVGLLYSLKVNAPKAEGGGDETPWDKWNELDSEKSVAGYERALRAGGHEVIPFEGDIRLPSKLSKYKLDICFNTCEGHYSESRESQVPAMLDMMRIPYTGSGVKSLSLALDKAMTKRVLQFYGIPTAAFQVFRTGDEPLDSRLNFPLFAKPALEGSGIGITDKSVCLTPKDLRGQIKFLLQAYEQPVLVEDYIDGREITAGLIGNLVPVGHWVEEKKKRARVAGQLVTTTVTPVMASAEMANALAPNGNGKRVPTREYHESGVRVFPPMEVDFSAVKDRPALYNSDIKANDPWAPKYIIPAPLTAKMTAEIGRLTVATFRALECYDFCRVDFRVRASDGQPLVLEINPLAGLTEGLSDLVLIANSAGLSYADLINGILEAGLKRYGMI